MEEVLSHIADQLQEDGNVGYSSSIDFAISGGINLNGGTAKRISMSFNKVSDEQVNVSWHQNIDDNEVHTFSLYEVKKDGDINFGEILGQDASDEELKGFDHVFLPIENCRSFLKTLTDKTVEWARKDEMEAGLDFSLAKGTIIHKSRYNFEVH